MKRSYVVRILIAVFALIGLVLGYVLWPEDKQLTSERKEIIQGMLLWRDYENQPSYELVHIKSYGFVSPHTYVELRATPEMMDQFKMWFITPSDRYSYPTTSSATQPTMKSLIVGPTGADELIGVPPGWWNMKILPDAEILTRTDQATVLVLSRKTGRVLLFRAPRS